MDRLRKLILIILTGLMIMTPMYGSNVFAADSTITVSGANGNATRVEKGTSMKMVVSGVDKGKSVSWSVTDSEGSPSGLAAVVPISPLTAILTVSKVSHGFIKVVATLNDGSGKKGEQVIEIADGDMTTIDDADTSIKYENAGSGEAWEENSGADYYNSTAKSIIPSEDDSYSSSAPAYAEFTFNGTAIQWIGETNYNCGIAEVYIDGIKEATIDPFIAPSVISQFVNFSKEGLSNGSHTIKIVAAGMKNPASTVYPGTRVLIDAFRYFGYSAPIDKAALITSINAALALNASDYTAASWALLQSALNSAIVERDDAAATQSDVNLALSNLQTAVNGLVLNGPAVELTGKDSVTPGEDFTVGVSLDNLTKGVYAQTIILSYDPGVFEYLDTTGANSNIQVLKKDNTVSGTLITVSADIGGVTGASTPIIAVSFKVKDGVQDVSSTISVTKAELGVMPEKIQVQAGLTSKTILVGAVKVNKVALQSAIATASADLSGASIGTEPGKYPQAAADALQAAIAAAQSVYDNSSATQAQVNDAITALNAAKATFDASVIPAPVALVFTLNPTSAAAGDTINISGKTSANTAVAVRVVKADETVVYSHNVASDANGNFTGIFTVPADLTSGILYGTAEQGTYKISSNVYIHEAGIPYTQPTEITTHEVTVDAENKTLGITNTTLTQVVPININVPANVADSSINVAQVLNSPSGGTVTTDPLPALNISAATTISTAPVEVSIPIGATVSASETWDGTIHLPTVKDNSTVTITTDAGKTATVDAVVEVGFGDVPLIWSKAVRILLPGQAGKLVGYSRGTTFTKITGTLSAETQAAADAEISAGGDAAIDVGADKVIWTKHFTKFVTYIETADKSALTTAVNTAQDLYNGAVEGDAAGQYASGSKAILKAEIDAANAILADATVDQAGVDAETAKLNASIDTFNAAKRVYSGGDSNHNGGVDIGDLAIVAYYYNCTVDSPNWADAKANDVNNDGIIDIEDLAYVASRIQD